MVPDHDSHLVNVPIRYIGTESKCSFEGTDHDCGVGGIVPDRVRVVVLFIGKSFGRLVSIEVSPENSYYLPALVPEPVFLGPHQPIP
jgi:hypothetical protein